MKARTILFLLVLLGTTLISFSQNGIDRFILNKEYDRAVKLINHKLEENQASDLYLKKGMVLNYQQQYQDALSVFLTGLNFYPYDYDLNAETAECLSALGNYHDALSYYRKAVSLKPENLILKAQMGRTLMNLDNYGAAYRIFSEIIKIDSTNIYWNKQLAFCAFKTANNQEAIKLFENIVSVNQRDYTSWNNLIKLYQLEKQDDNVYATISKAKLVFPDDTGLLLQEAAFCFGNKQYDTAKSTYESYFIAGGDSIYKALNSYGISLYFTNNEKEAIKVLNLCADHMANDPIVLFYLSLSHKKLVDFDLAEEYMAVAIEAATPSYLPEMYHHLGQIYGLQRKFKESIDALSKAYELDQENPEILFEIATTYEEFNSNKTLALNYYRIYLKEAGEAGKNLNYALTRMERIKEELFFDE